MYQKPFIMAKGGILESKTTCFTTSDGSDRYSKTITSHNNLIINRLDIKVIDN